MTRFDKWLRLAMLIVATCGCGYFQAGSWEDDPKNWQRAFGEKTPHQVALIHSLYTRYPHLTHEHSFYLQFRADRAFLEGLISKFNLLRGDDRRTRAQLIGEGPGVPEWFLPRPIEEYEVWVGMGTLRDARLFIDKDTGEAHFTHTQL